MSRANGGRGRNAGCKLVCCPQRQRSRCHHSNRPCLFLPWQEVKGCDDGLWFAVEGYLIFTYVLNATVCCCMCFVYGIAASNLQAKYHDYLQGQIGNPEGAEKPNKKYYDPRMSLRAAEESMANRLVKAAEDLKCVKVL